MNYPLKIVFVIFAFAIVCSAQTPEPTPVPKEAVELYQRSLIEIEKRDIESDEPRVRTTQFAQIVEDKFVLTVTLFSYDDKKKDFPRFEVVLGITEKQLGGNEEVFVQTMKSQPPNLPIMITDASLQPLKFNLIQSSFGNGSFNDTMLYFREESFKIVLKNEQMEELLRSNSIDFICGAHQFSVSLNDKTSLNNFIERERKITKLSRIWAKTQKGG